MKKIFVTIITALSFTAIVAQPMLYRDSLRTGLSFNLYSLSNVNTASLSPTGANVTWDLSTSTAVLGGTAEFLDMSSTPYAAQFPTANFAIKMTVGSVSQYSLFHVSATIMEEVANNVGTANQTTFLNARTTLVFPFTFNSSDSDVYQKNGQGTKSIVNKYDSYGTLITSLGTYHNVIRNLIKDDGSTSANFWSASPFFPLFQASNGSFTLWKSTSSSTGFSEVKFNSSFDMYPNPANNEISIINKEPVTQIEIFNIAGQFQFSARQSNIDISGLSPGLYFIKVYSVNGISTQKFIKQ